MEPGVVSGVYGDGPWVVGECAELRYGMVLADWVDEAVTGYA